MNNINIYQKSDLGREEIKSQSLGVLPREARTLLIMVDGKKTYQNYFDSLNKSKMFIEFGGIAPLFELLLDFQCIELIGQDDSVSLEQISKIDNRTIPDQLSSISLSERQIRTPLADTEATAVSRASQSQTTSEAEFAAEFNSKPSSQGPVKGSAISKFFKRNVFGTGNHYETVKSDLATYIEKNALPQDAWGYLLSLEQCENDAQLLALVQDIQNSTTGDLSGGMDKFYKTIKRQR